MQAALRSLVAALAGASLVAAAAPPRRIDLFGDPLPPGALARAGTVRFAHGDSLFSYPTFSRDQRTFAAVSNITPHGRGRVVCLWNAETGRELRHLHDPDYEHFQAFFLKTTNALVTLGSARRGSGYAMQFWDPDTGKQLPGTIRHDGYFFEPWALSADETLIAGAGRNPPVAVFDRESGRLLARWAGPKGGRVNALAFSPDGRTVAIGMDKQIHLWDWRADRVVRRLGEFDHDVLSLRYSPDGKYLAAGVSGDGLRVWATANFAEPRRFSEGDVRFFPDGKRFVAINTGVVRDVASGEETHRLERCAHCLTLAFSPDGKTATAYAVGRVRRWDTATGKDRSPPNAAAGRSMIHQVSWLPGGKAVAAGSADGAVRLLDAATGKEVRTLVPGTDSFHLQGRYLRVAADGTVLVTRGRRLSFFRRDAPPTVRTVAGIDGDDLTCLTASPDGRWLLLAGGANAGTAQLWDMATREPVATFPLPDGTSSVSLGLSADGRRLAACVNDRICLLDARTGRIDLAFELPTAPAKPRRRSEGYSYIPGGQSLAFSPEGRLVVAAGHAGGIVLLDTLTGKPRHVLVKPRDWGEHYELRNAAFSPDGRMLAVEPEGGVIEVWETASGRLRRRFLGHRSYQTALAFSPDGARLASGNRDATVLIWDIFSVADADGVVGAWDALGADAERAGRAMGKMIAFPDASVPLLKQRLLARKSDLAARLRGWVADLDSDNFAVREAASQKLGEHLLAAVPLLEEALAGAPNLEVRKRAERLLRAAETRSLSPEQLRDLRAVEVLEHLGAPAARLLRELAEGDHEPGLAAAARAARGRAMKKSP